MIYRYALEHVEEPLRSELINLRWLNDGKS
jgi:hypothetical protein